MATVPEVAMATVHEVAMAATRSSRGRRGLRGRVGAARFPLTAPSWPATVDRPDPERRVGLDYDHEWSRRYPVRLARAMVMDNVTRPAARLLAPATVRGLEHLEHVEGPVIFAANHASHIDTPLLLTTLPVGVPPPHRRGGRLGLLLRPHVEVGPVVLRPRRHSHRAQQGQPQVGRHGRVRAAEDGWSLVIFPEGGRSPDGWTQPFRGGAAYLARRTGRPVVPVYLHGTRHVLPKSSEAGGRPPGGSGTEARRGDRLRRSPIAVLFGPPMTPDDG